MNLERDFLLIPVGLAESWLFFSAEELVKAFSLLDLVFTPGCPHLLMGQCSPDRGTSNDHSALEQGLLNFSTYFSVHEIFTSLNI